MGTKPSRLSPIPYGDGQFDSGANPDFQVTSATRNAREMERLLRTVRSQSTLLDRKLRAVDAVASAASPVLVEPFDPLPSSPGVS